MKRILILSICILNFLTFPILANTAEGIDNRLSGTKWNGTYELSSGHTGEIQIDFGDEKTFYFVLPDEENGYEYTGKLTEAVLKDGEVVIHAGILIEKQYGIDLKGQVVDERHAITLPFEVTLKGVWLKATPGPQEIIEGKISFSGTSAEAKWFLDKTGDFQIIPTTAINQNSESKKL